MRIWILQFTSFVISGHLVINIIILQIVVTLRVIIKLDRSLAYLSAQVTVDFLLLFELLYEFQLQNDPGNVYTLDNH